MNPNILHAARSLVLAAAVLAAAPGRAGDFEIVDQPLPNGNFNDGLNHWTIESSPDPSTPPGGVDVVGGAARLAKGGAYRVALSQQFSAPDGLVAVRLRLAEMPQFTSTGAFIPEAFDVHVLGAAAVSRVASIRPGASAAANAAAAPAGFTTGPGTTLTGDVLRIELPGVTEGETLTLIAALVGASADTGTTVAIDDAVLEVLRELPPPDPPGPKRVDDCEMWRDGFEARPGLGSIPRCALGQIGDTGISNCAGGAGDDCPAPGLSGQDGDLGRDAEARAGVLEKLGSGPAGFDYTKLDALGEPLPASAADWSCVVDNYTGLIWEVKLDDPADPRHYAHTYTWLQPDPAIDGGLAGTADGGACTGSACDTAALVQAVNDLTLCGSDAWRVPTRAELATLVHAGASEPTLATGMFPLGGGPTWSITPMAADPSSAWQVDFSDGAIQVDLKSTALRVRLVREIQ